MKNIAARMAAYAEVNVLVITCSPNELGPAIRLARAVPTIKTLKLLQISNFALGVGRRSCRASGRLCRAASGNLPSVNHTQPPLAVIRAVVRHPGHPTLSNA